MSLDQLQSNKKGINVDEINDSNKKSRESLL